MPRFKVNVCRATMGLPDFYIEILLKGGKLSKLNKVNNLCPESIIRHIGPYLEIIYSHSYISMADREMMAVVVSASDTCNYFISNQSEALYHYWKDSEKTTTLVTDCNEADLNYRQSAISRDAFRLSFRFGDFEEAYETTRLKDTGYSHSALLDTMLAAAYFNFVNQIVLALGVEPEKQEIKCYNF